MAGTILKIGIADTQLPSAMPISLLIFIIKLPYMSQYIFSLISTSENIDLFFAYAIL